MPVKLAGMLAKRKMRQQLRFCVAPFILSCRSSEGEQSGLELKAAFSDTVKQDCTLNWTSDEKWANFHHFAQCECLIYSVCDCLCVVE